MIPWVHLDTATVSGGELRLMRRGNEFSIMAGATTLMSSRTSCTGRPRKTTIGRAGFMTTSPASTVSSATITRSAERVVTAGRRPYFRAIRGLCRSSTGVIP
jgi:hypothetical protein